MNNILNLRILIRVYINILTPSFSTFIVGRIQQSMLFFILFNIHCWKNINVDLYILFQHSLLEEYNNKCWSLYTFPILIVRRIQRSMLFFIYFFNTHCWKNTTINVVLYILFQHSLLEKYNINVDLYILSTFIVGRI